MIDWSNEKERLEAFINEGVTYEKIGEYYNCSGANIKKRAKKLGITLPIRRKINECETFNKGKGRKCVCLNCGSEYMLQEGSSGKFCSAECAHKYKHKMSYQKILDGDTSIMRANYSPSKFRDDILREQDGKCAICGNEPEWNGQPLIFIVDHIDGRASNNKRENLRCICPNCDSQLPTYKSKNKNGERHYYRYRKHNGSIDL